MNPGLLRIIDTMWSIFEGETKPLTDEEFKQVYKKEMADYLITFSKMFMEDLGSKPVTVRCENEEDFQAALKKAAQVGHWNIEDMWDENDQPFTFTIPFYNNIHSSLSKVPHSELIPVFRKIKGNFSFEIYEFNSNKILCTGKGSNGQFDYAFPGIDVHLPTSLDDLHVFGHDLTLLFELSLSVIEDKTTRNTKFFCF